MQLTAVTFVVENLHLSTMRITLRKFFDEFIKAEDSLNMDVAMIYKITSLL